MHSLAEGIAAAQRQTIPPPSTPTAGDLMSVEGVAFHGGQSVSEVISILHDHRVSGAAVVDERNHVIGFVSEHDCLRVIVGGAYEGDGYAAKRTVSDVMSRAVTMISSTLQVYEIAEIFISSGRRRLPVTEGNRLLGHLSRADVLSAVLPKR